MAAPCAMLHWGDSRGAIDTREGRRVGEAECREEEAAAGNACSRGARQLGGHGREEVPCALP
jgi:hypothetical protein